MGILNKKGALYYATGIDNSGLYKGRREAVGIVKGLMRDVSSFDVFVGIGASAVSAFAMAAKSSYNFEKKFQSSMLEVASISDEVFNNFEKYQQQIIDLTTDKGISVHADEASKALYQIVSAGHDGANGLQILEASAKAAVGGVTDTTTAADAITSLLNAYGLEANRATHVSDLLFTTVKLGKTTFGELGKYIAQVTPVAASYGVEMDQVLAAVATLTSSGTPTAQAMTQVRQAIIATSKYMGDGAFATKSFQEVLNELVSSANGSESALRKMIPEVEAVTGILGLTGVKAQKAAKDLGVMNNVAGATEKAFKKMSESADNQLKLLTNNITASLRPLGAKILKEVSEIAQSVNKAFASGDMERALETTTELLKVGAVAWGSYKVAVGLSAVASKYSKLSIIEEAKSLEELLTKEQIASISKEKLTKNTIAYASAVKAAAISNAKASQIALESAREEVSLAKKVLVAKKREYITAKQLDKQRLGELVGITKTGTAKQIEVAQRKLNIAQAKKESAALTFQSAVRDFNAKKTAIATTAKKANTSATIINTAAQNSSIKASKLLSLAQSKLSQATAKANAFIAANPYTAAAAALAVLTYAVYKLITHQTEAEKAQKRLNASIDEANSLINEEQSSLNVLYAKLERARQGTEEWNKARDEIVSSFGKYRSNLEDELKTVQGQKIAYDELTKSIRNSVNAKILSDATQNEEKTYLDTISAGDKLIREAVTKGVDAQTNEAKKEREKYILQLQEAMRENRAMSRGEIAEMWGKLGGFFKTDYGLDIKKAFEGVSQAYYSKTKFVEEAQKAFKLNSKMINGEKGDNPNETTGLEKQFENVAKSVAEAQKKIKEYNREIKNLRTGIKKDTNVEAAIEALQKKISAEKQTLKTLTGAFSVTTSTNNNNNPNDRIKESLLSVEMNLAKEKIAVMKEGKDKALAISEQEWKERKAQIEKDKEDLIAKYKELGQEMPEDVQRQFTERGELSDTIKKNKDSEIEKEYADKFKEHVTGVTNLFLSDEQKKREAVKKRYEDERKWAKQQLETKSISKEQYYSFISTVDEAEQKEQYKRLLEGLNDFEVQRKTITEEWDAKINEAITLNDTELQDRLIAGKEDALSKLNAQILMQSDEWQKLFSNMDDMTVREIDKLIKLIESKAKGLKLSPVDWKVVQEGLEKGRNTIKTKNPFKLLSDSIGDYRKASDEASKSKAFKKIAENTGAALDMTGDIFGSVTQGLKAMGMAGDEETQKLLGNITTMVGGAAELAKGIASGNPASIISGSIQFLTSAFDVFDSRSRKANRKIKKHAENLRNLQEEYRKLERAIERALGAEQYTKTLNLNRNKEQQIRELQGMIRAEQSKKKKKRDNNKIKEWEQQIQQLRNDIEDTKDKVLKDLLTTDIKSFADAIATTIVDGIDGGMESLGGAVDKNMDGLIRDIIKKQFSIKVVQEMMKPMLAYAERATSDANLTEYEIKRIAEIGRSAKSGIVSGWEQWGKIMEELGIESENAKKGVTGELKAEMTEKTGSQIVGLWNMTALDIRAIKEWLQANSSNRNIGKETRDFFNLLVQNTKNTADNTEKTSETLDKMSKTLDEIKENTENTKSRG